jgi:Glycosyl transferase family 2
MENISLEEIRNLMANAARPKATEGSTVVEQNTQQSDERLKKILDGTAEFLKEEKKVKTAERTANFLITSHTTGNNQHIKEKLLCDLVKSFKHYFPGCYVVVASASDVPDELLQGETHGGLADCVLIDKTTVNDPPALHGNGELALVNHGLDHFASIGKEWVAKFTYDFIINDSNFNMINEWEKIADTQNKDFVGTTWVDIKGSQWDVKLQQGTVGTWMYYGRVSFLKEMFDTMKLDNIIERKVTDFLNINRKWQNVYLYPSANDMLGGTWEACGDLVTNAGESLKPSFQNKPVVTSVKSDKKTVLVSLCTRNRYFTTLPMALSSISLQTRVPDKVIIYDDGEHKNLNDNKMFTHIFSTLMKKGCTVWMDWEGKGLGQHIHDSRANHAGFDYVYRFDDDEVMEHDVIERLLKHFEDDKEGTLGAVGGAVVDPNCGEGMATGKIEFIFNEPNFQWFTGKNAHKMEVEHLHGAYMYRAGIAEWNMDLSPVSHRGETMFSMEIRRKGYRLLADQSIVTWHYRNPEGGIRSHDNNFLYDHDEKIFMNYLEMLGYKVCVLDNGIGDHICFLNLLPELQAKWKHLIIGVCYPEVFEGLMRPGDSMISIGASPNPARLSLDLYTWMERNKWSGTMEGAYREIYNIKKG